MFFLSEDLKVDTLDLRPIIIAVTTFMLTRKSAQELVKRVKFIPHHYKLLVLNSHNCALIVAKELTEALLFPHNHPTPLKIVGDAQHIALKQLVLVFANMYTPCT